MLTIYRGHKGLCGHRAKGRAYHGCQCPIWVDGLLAGREIRKVWRDKTGKPWRDWQKAQDTIRQWEAEGQITASREPETLAAAWESFMSDCKARGLAEPTIHKYGYFRKQMEGFAKA